MLEKVVGILGCLLAFYGLFFGIFFDWGLTVAVIGLIIMTVTLIFYEEE